MKRTWKIVLLIVVIGIVVGAVIFNKIWNAPHRDVLDETAIKVTAQGIADSFETDEAAANKLYLDQAIQVTGTVNGVETTQEGKTILSFKTDDPMAGVRCTMKETPTAKPGESATVKGICSGYLMDVTLIECYQVK